MTGFARHEGHWEADSRSASGSWTWAWELRSVNSRGLDLRLRLPPGHDALEQPVRKRLSQAFARGAVSANLQLSRTAETSTLAINRDALDQVLALQQDLAGKVDPSPPRIEALLRIRGVVETVEEESDTDAREALQKAVLASLDAAVGALRDNRDTEGAALETVLKGHLGEIARLIGDARDTAEAQPAYLRQRLADQVAALLEADKGFSEERLAQEAALLATKADVREETDRLLAHLEAAENLLAADEPVGRKLDFLCQEFNREANTLCSKAVDLELTNIGLALKATVEQFREQVQNVE